MCIRDRLTVLLFMRKRNGLLSGALAMQALLPVFTLVSFLLNSGSRGFFETYEYELHFGPKMWAIGICGCYVLESLCYLLLTLMTITPCAKDGERKRGLHRLWFLPGILSIFIAFAHFAGNIYFKRSDLYGFSDLFQIPMAFLLGWWLTHPYKKEKPVYQMPIAQPYGQPVYQSVGTFDAAQKMCIRDRADTDSRSAAKDATLVFSGSYAVCNFGANRSIIHGIRCICPIVLILNPVFIKILNNGVFQIQSAVITTNGNHVYPSFSLK